MYSLEQFEQAKTHDKLWNAAQLELVHGGKMHGFMRMYWAKKILEWTKTPEQALEFAIHLNDKYSLDGRTRTGTSGARGPSSACTTRGGRSARCSGRSGSMALSGCEKKFKIPDYIARVNQLVAAVKAGEKHSAASNPGRFHIDFDAAISKGGGGRGRVGRVRGRRRPGREEEREELSTVGGRVRGGADADGQGGDGGERGGRGARGGRPGRAPRRPRHGRAPRGYRRRQEVKRLSKSEGNAELAAKAKAVVNAWKKIVVG